MTQTDLFVYGLGRSGSAVVRRARSEGLAVAFYDARAEGQDIDEAIAAGGIRVKAVGELDTARFMTCVAAPGVRVDHPDLELLRARGVHVTGEVEWTWSRVSGRYVGITGTAGKGSTTLWLQDLLSRSGVDAIAGGNNDPALAAVAREGATHVVELSSFQLERCHEFRPDVAVLLNLGEDHIDRHGSVAAYHAAKRRLLANLRPEDTFVYNSDDAILRSWARDCRARPLPYSTRDASCELYYDGATETIHLVGGEVVDARTLAIRGAHQRSNALAVAGAAHALGLPSRQIAEGITSFAGLRSRYEVVVRHGGILFVDDSIATRPLAVAAALASTTGPCVWLAGGQAKGADVAGLRDVVADHVNLLVAYGAAGPQFAAAFAGSTRVIECRQADGREALTCAVEQAVAFLEAEHGGTGTVLLSPLAASFDQFADYKDRARVFREVAGTLATARSLGVRA